MRDWNTFFGPANHKLSEAGVTGETKPPIVISLDLSFLTDLACAAWKLREKVFDPETGQPKADLRQVARQVTVIWDRLVGIGMEIQDHTGKAFDSGQSLEVIAFQPTKDVLRETVIETIRPTVYVDGKRILKGQVIVGIPENASPGGEQE